MYFDKKTKRIFLYSIIFVLFLFIGFLFYGSIHLKESFEIGSPSLSSYNINYYVITMGQEKRIENIRNQINKINEMKSKDYIFTLNHIDSINGDHLDLDRLVNEDKLAKEVLEDPGYNGFLKGEEQMGRRKYEVGCYMSHVKSMQAIADSNADYGIIFEDDFEIENGFFEELQKTLNYLIQNKIDFDILFLGMNGEGIGNKHIGEKIYKQSCKFDGDYINCYGLHGYLKIGRAHV